MKARQAAYPGFRFLTWLSVLSFLFLGCTPASQTASSPAEALTQTAAAAAQPTASSVTQTPPDPSPAANQASLTVWLPPQFHISTESPANRLLQTSIESFMAARPGLVINVRAKAESGEGGMLNALSAASSAAPAALPDLILLPRALLEPAALKGYLRVLDGMDDKMEDADWFEYARQMGRVQNSVFGIPFAGDLLVMMYNDQIQDLIPQTWQETLAITRTVGFAAGDPQALFTIALYQSAGGDLRDDQGRPMLDEEILARVLSLYSQANLAGQMPFWLMQYTSDSQALDLYRNGQADLLITWRSTLEQSLGHPAAPNIAGLPTQDGALYSLANGYVWVLAGSSPARQSQALELVQYLSDPTLLGEWNLQAGYLPPRMLALDTWPENAGRERIISLSLNAQLAPSTDLLEIVGPLLKQAVQQSLLQQTDPATAAQLAADSLNRP